MTDIPPAAGSPKLDTRVPHSARIWNYWMGGKDNFAADRDAGDKFAALYPGITDMAKISRYFLSRAVSYLVGEGVRQFLDIGTGLPTAENTHEVAQRLAPESRIVYVDNDPLVLAHARALLVGEGEGSVDYVDADLHDPGSILDAARKLLDFTHPVAIMLMGIMGHVPITDNGAGEDDDARGRSLVGRFKDALPSGGYLALYDGTNTDPAYVEAIRIYNKSGGAPYNLRSPGQITCLFEGLELLEPGVVPIHEWKPAPNPLSGIAVDAWGGIGRKP
jgi:hypothetical protein